MNNYGQYQSLFNDININESITSDSIYFNNAYGLDGPNITFQDAVKFQQPITLNGGLILTSDLNLSNFNINNINTTNTKNLNIQNVSGNLRVNINTVANEYVSNSSIGDAVIRSSGKMILCKDGTTNGALYITNSGLANRFGFNEPSPTRLFEVNGISAFRGTFQNSPRGFPNLGIGIFFNSVDGNSYSTYQGGLSSYNGIGFQSTFDFQTRHMFNTRNGNVDITGTLNCAGVQSTGDVSTINLLTNYIYPRTGTAIIMPADLFQVSSIQRVNADMFYKQSNDSTIGSIFIEAKQWLYLNAGVSIDCLNTLNLRNNNIVNVNSISGFGSNDLNINSNVNLNNKNLSGINKLRGVGFGDIIMDYNNLDMGFNNIKNLNSIYGSLSFDITYFSSIDMTNLSIKNINTISGYLTNDLNINSNVSLKSNSVLKFNNLSGSNFTSIRENSNSTTNKNYILPNVGPTTNTDILTCNTGGVMSWGTGAGFNSRIYSMISDGSILTNNTNSTIISDGSIIGSKVIPANTIQVGDTYEIKCGGIIKFLNNENFTIEARISNGIISIAGLQINQTLSPAQINNRFFNFVARTTFRTTGISANTISFGTFSCCGQSGGITYSYIFDERFLSLGTFNTTIDNTIDIYSKWTNASNNNSIQLMSCIINKIY